MTKCDLDFPDPKDVALSSASVEGQGLRVGPSPSCLTHASLPSSRATSPMLLVALAVFFGACYILYLRTLQSKFVLMGEKSPALLKSWSLGMQAFDSKPKSL